MLGSALKRIDRRLIALVLVVLLVAVLVNLFRSPPELKTVTAHFPRAVSVYKGTDVRVLGVNVGKVTAVIPEGNSVRVEMEYDASYKIPADAKAVIVTPTLVADRFVQLTPVYTGGEPMADGADIALPETGVPVELDRIYASLRTLTTTLGPNGVNADGTLDHLLQAGTKALEGQGARGNQMIKDLATAAQTFGDGAGPLFETVTHLAEFTKTLADNDNLVQAFMKDLTGVSAMLAEESDELQKAVAAVARAVGSVEGFVKKNRTDFVKDVRKLTEVLTTIASESENLDTAIKVAPVAMGNLQMGFDIPSRTQNSRMAISGLVWDADGAICAVIQQNPAMPAALKDIACQVLEALLEPILTKVGEIPPGYSDLLPRQTGQAASGTDTDEGIAVSRPVEATYSTQEGDSVTTLLGGSR